MFIAHVHGNGGRGAGCDYTIGCNQFTKELPESIKTMEEAETYMLKLASEYESDRIDAITIYEVAASKEVDYYEHLEKLKQAAEAEKAARLEEKEKQQLKALLAKHGTPKE